MWWSRFEEAAGANVQTGRRGIHETERGTDEAPRLVFNPSLPAVYRPRRSDPVPSKVRPAYGPIRARDNRPSRVGILDTWFGTVLTVEGLISLTASVRAQSSDHHDCHHRSPGRNLRANGRQECECIARPYCLAFLATDTENYITASLIVFLHGQHSS
jgi:hypothetical protein